MTKRHEYKYAVEGVNLSQIIDIIRFHPMGFSEAYEQRKVNNFYLDTVPLDFFYQNIDGIARRRKFRYRWYGELENTDTAQLEVKNKENELGWKETIRLDPKTLTEKAALLAHFQTLKLSNAELVPMLYNSYWRHYYESADGVFRITIDYKQVFGRPFHFGQPFYKEATDPNIIVELKFDETYDNRLDEVTTYLPFLRTKNSKYSNGITAIYF